MNRLSANAESKMTSTEIAKEIRQLVTGGDVSCKQQQLSNRQVRVLLAQRGINVSSYQIHAIITRDLKLMPYGDKYGLRGCRRINQFANLQLPPVNTCHI